MFEAFVTLPDQTKAGVILALAAGLSWLFAQIPIIGQFLQGYAGQIALALGSALFAFLEFQIPDAYSTITILVFQLALAILAALGVVVSVKHYRGNYAQGIKA